jgi:catalase
LSQTNLKDADAVWDFCSQHPESIHQFSFLFSDRGTPDGYRHMHGFSSHTFKFVNAQGEAFWTKLHYRTTAGVKNLPAEKAAQLEGADPDYATRDLFEHIEKDANNYKFNIFDVRPTHCHIAMYEERAPYALFADTVLAPAAVHLIDS